MGERHEVAGFWGKLELRRGGNGKAEWDMVADQMR